MKMSERPRSIPSQEQSGLVPVEIEDYIDAPYYSLLRRLPEDLAIRHLEIIERDALSEDAATDYLLDILAQRSEVMTSTKVSDPRFEEVFRNTPDLLKAIETNVFTDTNNFLGKGRTARVKSLTLKISESLSEEVAIKYVITPTEKTLSASGEHDVLHEAEILTTIEDHETRDQINTNIIRVPHPYFHHATNRLQCYGMKRVDGVTFAQGIEGTMESEFREHLKASPFCTLPLEEIFAEVDKFWAAVHELCLHGDMKASNIMIDRTGTIYVIDFGQAVLTNNVTDKSQDQALTIRDDEVALTKQVIISLRQRLSKDK